MPKTKNEDFEDFDEDDGNNEEDLDSELEADDIVNPKKSIPKIKPKIAEIAETRYSLFSVPQRIGIVDGETKEIIAEGELAVLQALSNIIERLERIETAIGNVLPN